MTMPMAVAGAETPVNDGGNGEREAGHDPKPVAEAAAAGADTSASGEGNAAVEHGGGDDLESGSKSTPGPAVEVDRGEGEYRLVPPGEILPSPFGSDINLLATEIENVGLEKDIAKNGINNPIIVEALPDGRLRCLAGTRRLRVALKLGLSLVPVRVMRFANREAARQFAIADNTIRRQLSTLAKAKLGDLLWRSYEKSGKREKHEETTRERAATAAGVGVGTLVHFRTVVESGYTDIIADMLSEKTTIDAAHRLMKVRLEERERGKARKNRTVKAESALTSLKKAINTVGGFSKLSEQVEAHVPSAAVKGNKADRERLRKQVAEARAALEKLQTNGAVGKLLETIARVEAGLQGPVES